MSHERRLQPIVAPAVIQHLQHICAAGQSGARIPTRQDLGERGEVRRHSVELLRSSGRTTEARDHFVEDQKHAMPCGHFAQAPQSFPGRRDLSKCRSGRLENQRRDVVARSEPVLHLLEVIRRGHQSVLHDSGNDTGRAAGRKANMVMPAMEVPGEAYDLALAGECARHAQREVRGLRAGHRETHPLCGWDHLLNQFGPLHFQCVAGAVMYALRGLRRDRFHDCRLTVTKDQRAVSAEIIDVLVAVHIPFARARGPLHIDRVRLQEAADVGNAVRQQRFGPVVQGSGTGRLFRIGAEDLRLRQWDGPNSHATYDIADAASRCVNVSLAKCSVRID